MAGGARMADAPHAGLLGRPQGAQAATRAAEAAAAAAAAQTASLDTVGAYQAALAERRAQAQNRAQPLQTASYDQWLADLSVSGDVPDQYVCPISTEIMVDPVCVADGHTYERHSIESWLSQHDTSPLTNEKLSHKRLSPNVALRALIQGYIHSQAQSANQCDGRGGARGGRGGRGGRGAPLGGRRGGGR